MNHSDSLPQADKVSCTPDPDLSIGYLLTTVRTRMLQEMDTALNPHGLTGAQFTILRRIAENAAHTAADLCRLLQYDTGSMTRMLDRLEEKGVICRERSPDDRRVVNIQLTTSGLNDYPKWREEVRHGLSVMFDAISNEEQVQLRDLLHRLVR
jgi:DNA-binding MarR family transcriptional regulator